MLKRLLAAFLIAILCLSAALAQEESTLVNRIACPDAAHAFAPDAALLRVVFPNVKDADAALIQCGGQNVLIDCASAFMGDFVADMLRYLGVERIDCIINTHPHHDHLLGLEKVAQAARVEKLLFAFPEDATDHMPAALATAAEYGIAVEWYGDGDRFEVGGAVLEAWLRGDDAWGLNDRSAVMRLTFGERSMLFAADAEYRLQRRLMEQIPAQLLDCDVLKYPHHGVEPAYREFLEITSPELAVITNAAFESTQEARKRLDAAGIPWAVTTSGYVCLTTDGQTWLAEQIPLCEIQ